MEILILDDSPSIRAILRIYLLPLNAGILEAGDGERALRLVRLSRVDLVIADVMMEPMDGITFVKTLRAEPREEVRCIPVVMLTGERSAEVERRGLEAGANAFVHKPIDGKALLDAIKRATGAAA